MDEEEHLPEAEENVVIQAGNCSITLLPTFGGKISSVRVGFHQLLQAPLQAFAPRSQTMAFSAGDASGWDECLPSVAQCSIETETGSVTIPDHGDLWRIPWQVLKASEDSATLRATCLSLPLALTRSIMLTETASGWTLQMLYSLTNIGSHRAPWSWSAHPLFATEPGDRILLPASVKALRLEGSAGNRLGKNGDTVDWPIAAIASGAKADLSLTAEALARTGDKLFAGPLRDNWAALDRPSIGLRLTVRFDPELTPYLGLWLCYGGWPDGPGPKQVCVALEPATAPVDSLAITGAWSRWLGPGETIHWPMELEIQRITNPDA